MPAEIQRLDPSQVRVSFIFWVRIVKPDLSLVRINLIRRVILCIRYPSNLLGSPQLHEYRFCDGHAGIVANATLPKASLGSIAVFEQDPPAPVFPGRDEGGGRDNAFERRYGADVVGSLKHWQLRQASQRVV